MNKKIIKADGILVHIVSKMRAYCSMSHNFSTFNTPHDALFLVFGVSNAKYLAFDTPDENALIEGYCSSCQIVLTFRTSNEVLFLVCQMLKI